MPSFPRFHNVLASLLAAAGLGLPGAAPARAAIDGAWQTHLRTKDVTDMVVTDSTVWCATSEAGLLRYDRQAARFESIVREPGAIASNHLTCVTYDRIGRLWVGTFASGVSRLRADESAWELVNAFDGLPSDSVTTITVAGDTLWIGTRRGIALWDGRQVLGSLPDGNTTSFDTTFVNPAITGVEQIGDTLWLSTPRGVGFARVSSNLTDWRKANAGLPTTAVDHLASDGASLYAQANGFVYRWEPDSTKWLSIGFIGIVHGLESENGTVLVSTESGIWYHRADNPLFTLIQNSPTSVPSGGDDPEPSVDPNSGLLFAGGRSALDPPNDRLARLWEQAGGGAAWTPHTPPGPPGNTYSNIVIEGPRVYAATRNEGIGRWDGADWFLWPRQLCSGPCPDTFRFPDEVFAMVVDANRHKWVACWSSAMERFDDLVDPDQFTHLWVAGTGDRRHTLAYGAAADSNGGVWFGMDTDNSDTVTPLGLDHYDAFGNLVGTWGPGSPANSRVRAGKIRAVTVDSSGRVWIGYAGGANSGVDHFTGLPEDPNTEFRTVSGTASFDVWAMVAHGDSIWVLTDRDLRRIGRVNRILSSTSYETPAGRPLGMRLMDVAPNGEVYVASEEGVRRYRRDGTTIDYTEQNSPLASNDVRAVAVDRATGQVWFGTAEGLNRLDPAYVPNPIAPGGEDTLRVYPNPATLTGLGIQLRLQGASAGYVGGIYDLRGRLVHRFSISSRGQVFWNGRDDHGVMVTPGVYFVRAEGAGGRIARSRFVLLH
jgi:ligand-binding sensor domain-containing protein